MKKIFFALTVIICFMAKPNAFAQYKMHPYPMADGTFIQDDLASKWSDERWQQEFKALKEAGMHYIIFAPTLHSGRDDKYVSMYPSNLAGVQQKYPEDIVDNCLRNARIAGLKVFLGLNLSETWWDANFTYEWLKRQMEIGNDVADELVKKYKSKYDTTMYGWYWVWEVDNIHCTTDYLQKGLAEMLNTNLDHLHSIAPSMPMMLCPFMNYRLGTAKENGKMWANVFSYTHFAPGDIFAPQDCIGAGGLKLDTLAVWFREMKKAVDTKPGLLFWSDAETFDQRFWTIAPLDRFIKQMNIVKPYVSNIISFAYSHYYSPYKVNKGYHQAYVYYVAHGHLPSVPTIQSPGKINIAEGDDKKLVVTWESPADSSNIAGYYIYRNGTLISNWQLDNKPRRNKLFNTFKEKETLKPGVYTYGVCTYTFTGKTSLIKSIRYKVN